MILVNAGSSGDATGLRGVFLARELCRLGVRAFVVPPQLELSQRQRLFEMEQPHVVLHQTCRHSLNRPWFFPRAINILDLDDADFLDEARRDTYIDVASRCDGAIAGSRFVASWLSQFCDKVTIIWTSSPLIDRVPSSKPGTRQRVVGWAVSSPLRYEVEAGFVRDVLLRCATYTSFRFVVNGSGCKSQILHFFRKVAENGVQIDVLPYMQYNQFVDSLDQLAVGLAPLLVDSSPFSQGKSFGKILAYLAADVPIVATPAADYPLFFRDEHSALLREGVEATALALARVLEQPCLRDRLAGTARLAFKQQLSIQRAASDTLQFIESVRAQCC